MKKASGETPYLISGVSGEGVKDLLRAAHARVRLRDAPDPENQGAENGAAAGTWRP
jgi:GTP-binding protein